MRIEKYELLDSGGFEKLEKFGKFLIRRPCSQAVWKKGNEGIWENANASFSREKGKIWKGNIDSFWFVEHCGIKFKLKKTDFGHLGIFPEHAGMWKWMNERVESGMKVLNLFAYTGGVTLNLAKIGAQVCHVDSSKGTVNWARENAELNGLKDAKIRWIVDDAIKFMKKEIRRGNKYQAIVMDPPSYGRGSKGEIFKIEDHVGELLALCKDLLAENASFLVFSCHTPGFTPIVMKYLMEDVGLNRGGKVEGGEMLIDGSKAEGGRGLPSGSFSRWCK